MNQRAATTDPPATTLIVGVGSVHGDDVAGWAIAEQLLQQLSATTACVRIAQSPLEILHWLDRRQTCVICDASHGAGDAGVVRCWQWPCEEITRLRWSGTHDVPLPQVLQLADQLGILPPEVAIWSIEADRSNRRINLPNDYHLSEAVESNLTRIVEFIVNALRVENSPHA